MSKIYVVASSTLKSGGAESLHQLVSKLNDIGYESYIYYKNPQRQQVVEKFKSYNIKIATYIEDEEGNLLVVPEVFTGFLNNFKKIKKAIWWLSLDFHFLSTPDQRARKFLIKKNIPLIFQKPLEKLMLLRNLSSLDDYDLVDLSKEGKSYYHFYNCEYVKEYLIANGVARKKMNYLCGPLADQHFVNDGKVDKVPNLVIYNPSKGLKFTKRIIEYAKKNKYPFIFKPLENMNQETIIRLEREAMLYIDFGFFPGPERIPRESVLHECLLLTNRKGSALNNEDIKIPATYKFEDKDENIPFIVEKMNDMMQNYDLLKKDFESYRKKVIQQKIRFDSDVNKVVKLALKGEY
jgi:hypothetical protein